MRLYDGVTEIGSAVADGGGAWTITSSTLGDGGHSLTATATDAAGNVSAASGALSVVIDTVAPAGPAITGYGEDTGTADGRTTDTDLQLTGTAEAGAIVAVFDGATPLGSALADGSGNWEFDTGTLAEGPHSFTATATDVAGNTGTGSSPLAVTVEARLLFDLSALSAAQGFIIQGDAAFDLAGWSVSSAGDVNGDGFDDLIVGAPDADGDDRRHDAGEAYVVFGKAAGFGHHRPRPLSPPAAGLRHPGRCSRTTGAGYQRLLGGRRQRRRLRRPDRRRAPRR